MPEDNDTPKFTEDPEVKAYIEEQVSAGVEAGVGKLREELTPEEPEKPGIESFVESGWEPKSWNDVFGKISEVTSKQSEETYKRLASEEKEELNRINTEFDGQLDEIRKGGAEIDKKTEKEIFKLGVKLGSTNLKELYNIHQQMKAVEKAKEEKTTLSLGGQASKVKSSAKPGEGGKKTDKSYASIAGKSMDDLIDSEFGN